MSYSISMEDDEAPVSVPVLESHEADAIFGVLVRLIRCDVGNSMDRERIAELQAAIDTRTEGRAKLMAAIDAFGFESEVPKVWDRVKKSLGEDRFSEAYHVAFPEKYPRPNNVSNTEKTVSVFTPPDGGVVNDSRQPGDVQTPKISDAILQYLRSIYGRGAQVAEVKKHLRDVYGIETHEKTPGMTLYRLAKDGLVRRDSRTWYATEITDTTDIGTARQAIETVKAEEGGDDDYDRTL
jgi:hypothetical protein